MFCFKIFFHFILPIYQRRLADGNVADDDHFGNSKCQVLALTSLSDQSTEIIVGMWSNVRQKRWRPMRYLFRIISKNYIKEYKK